MRYFDVDEVTFKNALGRSVKIKDLLPIPVHSDNSVVIALAKDDELDEIATRTDIYGEGYEAKVYDIFIENVEELVQNDFDMNKLKRLRIPS